MQMKGHKQNPGSCSELPWNKSGITALQSGNDSSFKLLGLKGEPDPMSIFKRAVIKHAMFS